MRSFNPLASRATDRYRYSDADILTIRSAWRSLAPKRCINSGTHSRLREGFRLFLRRPPATSPCPDSDQPQCTNLQEVVVPNASDWLMEEAPAATIVAVKDFLAAH